MQKALIYARVSSERQASEGHGLDSQEHRCRDLAKQRGYEVERVFRDSFSGGGDFTKRPAMSEMLSYMDSKPYNSYVVIFDDLKRLARDTEQYLKLKKALQVRHALVECPNFVFSESPEGQYVETIMAATAQLEREQNRRQVMQKMKARLELGYWTFPDLPTGYEFKRDPVHGMLAVVVPNSASVLKQALEGYASGRFMQQEDVRKFLQDSRILGSRPVHASYVNRILTKIFYAGYIEYPQWEVSRRMGKHEALIDLATYERIQLKMRDIRSTHIKKMLNEDFPLRGFVLCGKCRQPVTASWSTGTNGKFAYYRCKTKSCPEQGKSTRKTLIETEFSDILRGIKPNPQVLALTKEIVADVWKKKTSERTDQKTEVEREIKKIDEERTRFIRLAARATDERVVSAYEEEIGKLAERQLVLKDTRMSLEQHAPSIETALDVVFDFLRNPLKQWEKGGIHTKRLVLKLVFQEKLAYNRKSGFETAILSLPLRVFTLSEAQKPLLVEVAEIESASESGSESASTTRSFDLL